MLIRTTDDLGNIIRAKRRELALTQQALAEQVGVSRQWIVGVERGKPRAEVGLLLRVLRVLGLLVLVEPRDSPLPRHTTPFPDVDIDAVVNAHREIDR